MAELKEEVKSGKEEDPFSATPASPALPTVPYDMHRSKQLQKKKKTDSNKMSLNAADPNYHRVFYALDSVAYKVGKGGEYVTYSSGFQYTTSMSLSCFGWCYSIDDTTKNIVVFDMEAGNTFVLGFAGTQYATGMVMYNNQPSLGDQLYLLLGGSVTGCFRVSPVTGIYYALNTNDYTNAKFVLGDGANMVYYCDGSTGIFSLDLDTNTTAQLTTVNWAPCTAMCYDNGYIYALAQNGIWKIAVPSYTVSRINYTNWSTGTAMVADGVGNLYFTTSSGTTHNWYTLDLSNPLYPTYVTAGWGHTCTLVTFDTSDPQFTVPKSDVENHLTSILGVSSSVINLHLPTYYLTHKLAQLLWFYYSGTERLEWISDEYTADFDVCVRQVNTQIDYSYAAGASVGYYHDRYAFGYLRGSLNGTPTTLNWFLTRDWANNTTATRNYYLFFFDPLTGTTTTATPTGWTFDEIWG